MAAQLAATAAPADEEGEEDYLSMTFAEPTVPRQKETYTQRRLRKEREAEQKCPKSKAELKAQEASARELGLAEALPEDSKGARMMAKLGFKPGTALGAQSNPNARIEPLHIELKEDRGGIGLDNEKKRKFREEAEGVQKKAKVDESEYRERVAREREEKRIQGLWWSAMRVLESLEEPRIEDPAEAAPTRSEIEGRITEKRKKKKKKIVPVLYRPLVKEREDKEQERRCRADLLQSLSRDRNYHDPEEDDQDRLAFGEDVIDVDEGTDEELDEYTVLQPRERLARVTAELRKKWWYCFWCKFRYEGEEMEGCPGSEEVDHD